MNREGKWISVKDRLPGKEPLFGCSMNVLVRSKNNIFIASYDYKERKWTTDFKYHNSPRRLDVDQILYWYAYPLPPI